MTLIFVHSLSLVLFNQMKDLYMKCIILSEQGRAYFLNTGPRGKIIISLVYCVILLFSESIHSDDL